MAVCPDHRRVHRVQGGVWYEPGQRQGSEWYRYSCGGTRASGRNPPWIHATDELGTLRGIHDYLEPPQARRPLHGLGLRAGDRRTLRQEDQLTFLDQRYQFLRDRSCKKPVSRHRPSQTVHAKLEPKGSALYGRAEIGYDCGCSLIFPQP